jgi:hypothetical protein
VSTTPNRFEVNGAAIVEAVYGSPKLRRTVNMLGREIASEARRNVAAVGGDGTVRDNLLSDIGNARKLNYKGIGGQGTAPRKKKNLVGQFGAPSLKKYISDGGNNITGLVVSNSVWSHALEYGGSILPMASFLSAALNKVQNSHSGYTVRSKYLGQDSHGGRPAGGKK